MIHCEHAPGFLSPTGTGKRSCQQCRARGALWPAGRLRSCFIGVFRFRQVDSGPTLSSGGYSSSAASAPCSMARPMRPRHQPGPAPRRRRAAPRICGRKRPCGPRFLNDFGIDLLRRPSWRPMRIPGKHAISVIGRRKLFSLVYLNPPLETCMQREPERPSTPRRGKTKSAHVPGLTFPYRAPVEALARNSTRARARS